MGHTETREVLQQSSRGDERASQALLVEVYGELHRIAAAQMSRERSGHTLQPTALVHEAFLRLVHYEGLDLTDRAHFFAVAARCIRRILLEHARSKRAQKRGGDAHRVTLVDGMALGDSGHGIDLIDLDDLLRQLEGRSSRQAQVVELRFFGGQSVEEVALTLGVSERTVKSDWRFARAWLHSRMFPSCGG